MLVMAVALPAVLFAGGISQRVVNVEKGVGSYKQTGKLVKLVDVTSTATNGILVINQTLNYTRSDSTPATVELGRKTIAPPTNMSVNVATYLWPQQQLDFLYYTTGKNSVAYSNLATHVVFLTLEDVDD
jgi:hypothetical protein